ncbi:hypothetical protein BGZ72_003655 [Mortierella alpina]|nr:hypothetical protein BGZ72_003655 [Mortierella alpina]
MEEMDRFKALTAGVVKEFADNSMKDASAVAEVVQLAPVLSNDHTRFLLNTFIDAVNGSEMLQIHSMEGLAKVIQGAAPGSINSNDLVVTLRCLHKRLQPTHSEEHRYHLLVAVSRILDAMVDAQVGDVDRISLHEPLTECLRELESSKNSYLAFQAAYATQALGVTKSKFKRDNIWQAGFRRVLLVLKGGAGFARLPDPRELKDALEGVERIVDASRGVVRGFKNIIEAVKTHEKPTLTVKQGVTFKRRWYRILRIAESYIQTGKLVQFKELVTTPLCRHQSMYQRGICQLVGRFAADSQWDLKTRTDAVAFLGVLYRTDSIWEPSMEIGQVIFDVLTNLESNFEGTS